MDSVAGGISTECTYDALTSPSRTARCTYDSVIHIDPSPQLRMVANCLICWYMLIHVELRWL